MSIISKKEVYSYNGKDYETEIDALKAREELFLEESKQGLWDFYESSTLSVKKDEFIDYEYSSYKTNKIFALPHNLSIAEQYTLINNYTISQKNSLYHTVMGKKYLWEKPEHLGYGIDVWNKIHKDKEENSRSSLSSIVVIVDLDNFYTIRI